MITRTWPEAIEEASAYFQERLDNLKLGQELDYLPITAYAMRLASPDPIFSAALLLEIAHRQKLLEIIPGAFMRDKKLGKTLLTHQEDEFGHIKGRTALSAQPYIQSTNIDDIERCLLGAATKVLTQMRVMDEIGGSWQFTRPQYTATRIVLYLQMFDEDEDRAFNN